MQGLWARIAALLLTLAASATANADDGDAPDAPSAAPSSSPERPWAVGVPQAVQEEALRLFEDGNRQFVDELYIEARGTYQNALSKWDHPSIRFNLSECLIHLDRPVEAYEHLNASLKFGASPLGERVYRRALTRKKLLESSLATIEISGKQSGARFSLDGKELFAGPGKKRMLVRPGRHLLVAEKPGFVTYSKRIAAIPGEPLVSNVELAPIVADGVEVRRKWPAWVPWTVVGAGAAIGLAGGGMLFKGQSDLNDFDDAIVAQCPGGCLEDDIPDLLADKNSANRWRTVGGILLGTGAAVAVTGTIFVILNQPKKIKTGKSIEIDAMLAPGTAGLVVRGSLW